MDDLAGVERADEPVLDRIHRAKNLYRTYAERLMRDDAIRALLDRYRAHIEQTGGAMMGEGIGAACSACARQNLSGCCFSGIEEGYDEIHLLLNLLLGCPLPESRVQQGSCFFVGELGCRLTARYYFCLHYFCPALERSLGGGRIGALQLQVGRELQSGCKTEEAVRKWLKAHP